MTNDSKRPTDGKWPSIERRKPGWALDWQSAVEREKGELARTLHDETGGLLVAAVMDVKWVESRLSDAEPGLKERLTRALRLLEDVVDLNRTIIEELRPTLLENFGLVAALTWLCKKACKASGASCDTRFPDPGPHFLPAAGISIYRMMETLLGVVIASEAQSIAISLSLADDRITLLMRADGMPAPLLRDEHVNSNALGSVMARAGALGGQMKVEELANGISVICEVAAAQALMPA